MARLFGIDRRGRIGPRPAIRKGRLFRPAVIIAVDPFAPLVLLDLRAPAAPFGIGRAAFR